MTKVLTKKEMITKILEAVRQNNDTFPTESFLKKQDRDNLEFICEEYGIQVYIKDTNKTTFERLIGYDFGGLVLTDICFNGSKKQYLVTYDDGSIGILSYRDFKKEIAHCDYPK